MKRKKTRKEKKKKIVAWNYSQGDYRYTGQFESGSEVDFSAKFSFNVFLVHLSNYKYIKLVFF